MNWEALSAIGQLLSALGVVVTLAYLARQIRVSNDAAADANRLQRAAGVREMQLALSTNEALRATWYKALGERPATDAIARRLGLTRDEADQLTNMGIYWQWLHWGQWASSNSPKDLAELAHLIEGFYALPAMRVVWEEASEVQLLDPAFVHFVNSCLARARASVSS